MITINNDILARTLAAVLPTASTDPGRPHLSCVMFDTSPERGKVCVVTTDGHRLTRAIVHSQPSTADYEAILMPIDTAKRLAKDIKPRSKKADPFEVTITATSVEWPSGRASWAVIDETFPPYEKVIPRYDATRDRSDVCVDPGYISDAGKQAKAFGAQCLRVQTAEALDPFLFTCETPLIGELTIVVMPRRF